MDNQTRDALAALAVSVSTLAPLRLKPPGFQCYIPHNVVLMIRARLDAAQIDWRGLHKAARERK